MKSLVIAEKPSVARDIARVLHCQKKSSSAMEGSQYIVTWALGHLVTLADPEAYDKKYAQWSMDTLPMMPKKMELVVIKQTAKQYQAVKTQLFRKDVDTVIIATDAGREGELAMDKTAFEEQNVFGLGAPNDAFARYFAGRSYLNPLTRPEDGLFLANVTFEPGCRNNWHIHHARTGGGQLLICTAGEGWYQEEGKEAVSLEPGRVIVIPAEVKHWHGAKRDSWFSHIAVEMPGEACSNEWCEPVSDAEYEAL